eukprot:CAMPEP_0171529936 /NCGR_PEP_ID=MMETSP0959-20130129/12694_1 /TAXON_ID=87120 /ORGANISM="Aurantiochytrium limacinum, Strain ATCCMYA-1381" /LENGTH=39 /DNA_ID= /DNA_START= /DNA_END= /DNA_ORIENTATION=
MNKPPGGPRNASRFPRDRQRGAPVAPVPVNQVAPPLHLA